MMKTLVSLSLLVFLVSCATTVRTVRSPNREMSTTTWIEVANEHEFWDELYKSQKAFVVFGADWCGPCHLVKRRWEQTIVGGGLKLIYWETRYEDAHDIVPIMWGILHSRGYDEQTAGLPVCAVMVSPRPGVMFQEIVKYIGTGSEGCDPSNFY